MKRLLSMILVAVLVMACLPVYAFAAGDASVSANSVVGVAGGSATITYTVDGEFANFLLQVSSDSALTMSGYSGVTGEVSTQKVAKAFDENVSSHSFTVTFDIAAGTPAGKYPVSVNVIELANRDLEDQNVSVNVGYVIIEGEPEPPHEHSYELVERVEPTCDEDGYELYECSCGDSYTVTLDALGHDYKLVETVDADCVTAGYELYRCANCGDEYTVKIDAYGHTAGHWEEYECKHNAKKCTHVKYCQYCDEIVAGPESCWDHMSDHPNYNGWYYCTKCGHELKKATTVTPDDPNLDDVPRTGDITGEIVMATSAAAIFMVAAVAFVFKRKTAK